MTDPVAAFLNQAGGPDGPLLRLGVAVSGGSDSTALLILASDWAKTTGTDLICFTVDHGLRPEADEEARQVAALCASFDIPHETLRWTGWDGQGNVQDAARRARYALLAKAARDAGCAAVALGHTRDDQAETFLMRLARGSGVDGLSAMRADWRADGMRWLRPLLTETREGLRAMLRDRGPLWIEDPSNSDPRFDRVKMRQALQDLAALGLDADRLAGTAQAMGTARAALAHLAHKSAKEICQVEAGDVVIDPDPYWDLPQETRERIIAEGIRFVSSTPYRPRLASLRRSLVAARDGQSSNLQGCLIHPHRSGLRVIREPSAVAGLTVTPGQIWDGRWRIESGLDGEIRALGEGLTQIKDWRDTGLPRQTLLSSPALWAGKRLLAAPLVEKSDKCRILMQPSLTEFLTSLLSH
ncbi:tRNA lysidine(34) synthetase TilS [Aliiroseovarius crassostreae]|uniref:tRNA lysidine(34) synthetase TilS n=1 Tax=Aliiroseovarius crassostreae TaxID=154981 RepID=UPI003C7A8EFE